ncbi:MAG: hypothetical protein HY075_12185 [Deltaproteobacteria bacterium]|nr:hypothetical protein [Deltaproteobacteria bacterium]
MKKNKHNLRSIAAAVFALGLVASVEGSGKDPIKKPPPPEPVPVLTSFDQIPDLLKGARDWGVASNACMVESFGDPARSTLASAKLSGSACNMSKLYDFVCDTSKTTDRRVAASFAAYKLRVRAVIDSLKDKDKAAFDELDRAWGLDEFQNQTKNPPLRLEEVVLKGTTQKALSADAAGKLAKLVEACKAPQNDADLAFRDKVDAGFFASVKQQHLKRAQSTLERAKDLMGRNDAAKNGVLDRQMRAVLDALQPYDKNNIALVVESFTRMKQAIADVEIDVDATRDVCVDGQSNTLFVRAPNGKNKIVVCPATLLSGDDEALMGSIATALSHAIDPCALDSMSIGQPAVSMGGLLEPMRACLGAKVGRPKEKAKNVRPELVPPIPFPDKAGDGSPSQWRKDYDKALAMGDFDTQAPAAPHCNKPLTGEELNKLSQLKKKGGDLLSQSDSSPQYVVNPRDQSGDAVAQFFADKVLAADLAQELPGDRVTKARRSLAPYCDTFYHARGTHPAADDLINRVVGSDPDMIDLFCPNASGTNADRVKAKKAAERAFTSTDPLPVKEKPSECDGELARGFAFYSRQLPIIAGMLGPSAVPKFSGEAPKSDSAGGVPVKKSVVETPAVDVGNGVTKPVGETKAGGAGAQGTTADAPLPVPGVTKLASEGDPMGGPIFSYDETPKLAGQLRARQKAIDLAMSEEKKKCVDIVVNGNFPVQTEQDLLTNEKACNKGTARVDMNLFDKPDEVEESPELGVKYKVKVGCQVRCQCGPAMCYFPEPVYLGIVPSPGPEPKKNKATIAADVFHYLRRDEGNGRFSVASKACFRTNPPEGSAEFKAACAANGPKDEEGLTAVPPPKPVTLLGETSGALLKFGCDFRCDCGAKTCRVRVQPPIAGGEQDPPVATDAELAKIESAKPDVVTQARSDAGLPKDSALVYLSGKATTVPPLASGTGKPVLPGTAVAVSNGNVLVGSQVPADSGDSGVAPPAVGGSTGGKDGASGGVAGKKPQSGSSFELGSGTDSDNTGPANGASQLLYSDYPNFKTPDPSGRLISRNKSESDAEKKAADRCVELWKAEAKRQGKIEKTLFDAFCDNDPANDKFLDFPLEPILPQAFETGDTDRIAFNFRCVYDCSPGLALDRRAKLKYVGQTPPSGSLVDLGSSVGREDARRADFARFKPALDQACRAEILPNEVKIGPQLAKQRREAVEKSVEQYCAAGKSMPVHDERDHFSKDPGDLSGGPVPYRCDYKCSCYTKMCDDAEARLVKPAGGEDLRGMVADDRPAGTVPVVANPDDTLVKSLDVVASKQCVDTISTFDRSKAQCLGDFAVGQDVLVPYLDRKLTITCVYPCSCDGDKCTINGGPTVVAPGKVTSDGKGGRILVGAQAPTKASDTKAGSDEVKAVDTVADVVPKIPEKLKLDVNKLPPQLLFSALRTCEASPDVAPSDADAKAAGATCSKDDFKTDTTRNVYSENAVSVSDAANKDDVYQFRCGMTCSCKKLAAYTNTGQTKGLCEKTLGPDEKTNNYGKALLLVKKNDQDVEPPVVAKPTVVAKAPAPGCRRRTPTSSHGAITLPRWTTRSTSTAAAAPRSSRRRLARRTVSSRTRPSRRSTPASASIRAFATPRSRRWAAA